MPALSLSYHDLVTSHFAKRPNLREVIAREGFTALLDRYPWIADQHPQLRSLEGFSIIPAPSSSTQAGQRDLVGTLLESFLSGTAFVLTASDALSIAPPKIFHAQERGEDSSKQPQIDLDMLKVASDFNACLAVLPQAFQHAQAAFWNGCDDDTEVSRLGWLEQLIKAALLGNANRQLLDDVEKRMLFDLLEGNEHALSIAALQVTLSCGTKTWHPPMPQLLVTSVHAERPRLLCCKPSGIVRSYPDESAFATALRDELAERYRFDGLCWAQQAVTGDPLAYQAGQVLNVMLDDIRRVRLAGVADVSELENTFNAVSNPASLFLKLPLPSPELSDAELPAWLQTASPDDRFNYHAALLDLAALQGQAGNSTPFGDIEDLKRYAKRRLSEQLLADHPDVAQLDPDHVLIRISQAIPANAPADARALYLRSESLTELAIARLHLGEGEVMTGVSDANHQILSDWLTTQQIRGLVHAVNVGGEYPAYVKGLAYAPARHAQRVSQHGREWRLALLLNALQSKIETHLDEPACQALVDFCLARGEPATQVQVAPMAVMSAPGASTADIVHGMFLIHLPVADSWILYRPFYQQGTVHAFASLELLMAAIREPGELQQSILDWLDDDSRPVYSNGGFTRPHLHRGLSQLSHLISTDANLVDALLEKLKQPVRASFKAWTEQQLPDRLFDARVDAMLLLAANSSTSNEEEKWALARQAAWAAFNTTTLFLHGTLATLVWLATAIPALKNDFDEWLDGNEAQKAMAATDLLTNLAMLVAHRGASRAPAPPARAMPEAAQFAEPAARRAIDPEVSEKPVKNSWQDRQPATFQISRWHHNQRLGNMTKAQRTDLIRLQASITLAEQDLIASGRLRGLYRVNQSIYTKLQGVPFEVWETYNGVQIIGPAVSLDEWQTRWSGTPDNYHIVGRERLKGPWLARWNGDWVVNLALEGGMPKGRAAAIAENRRLYHELEGAAQANEAAIEKLRVLITRNQTPLQPYDDMRAAYEQALHAQPERDPARLPEKVAQQGNAMLTLRRQLRPDLRASALYLEKQSKLLHDNIGIFRQLIEPHLIRVSTATDYQQRLNAWNEMALKNDTLWFRRLQEVTDYSQLQEQVAGLHKYPETPEQIQRYLTVRDLRRETLGFTRRLYKASEQLDELAPEILDKSHTQAERQKIERIIRSRPYSSRIVRAQLISELSKLTLNKELLTDETAADLIPLQDALDSKEFTAMVRSQDGLSSAELPLQEQIEVLNEALREYRTTLGKAHYMKSFTLEAVNSEILDEYIQALDALILQTETQLSNALGSLDSGVPLVPPQPTYRVRPARRTLIRTSRGRSVLVEHDQGSSRAVQRNPVDEQPAEVFELRGDEWHELPGQEQPAQEDSAQLRRRAARLLTQKDQRLTQAARHANEPNSLTDLMDWHVDDLQEALRPLEQVEDAEARRLTNELREAIRAVTEEKRRLLTDTYINTRHPDATALRYLNGQGRLLISATTTRKALRTANDFLDVYEIRDRNAPGRVLWEAHFHYRNADAAPHDFAKGHLKLWEARGRERDASLKAASSAAQRLEIYRGDLRLEQIDDIIPFPVAPDA